MASLNSKKGLFFLIFLLILMAVGIFAVSNRTNIFPRATPSTMASVRIAPGQIITSPNGPSVHLSAQAVDASGSHIDNARYQWGMSSTNSIGTIVQETGNDKLATFTPSANIGQGDIWVRAFERNGQYVTGSIPVFVGMQSMSPTSTPAPNSCSSQPNGASCEISNCPVCNPGDEFCSKRPCIVRPGMCQQGQCVSITPTPTLVVLVPTSTVTPTPTPAPSIQTLEFRYRFAGVSDDKANGAQVTFTFRAPSVFVVSSPQSAQHIGNGVYRTTMSVESRHLHAAGGYEIILKGEKHVARKFCRLTGQTGPCDGRSNIEIPFGSVVLDFTSLALDPGDLPPQDGKADSGDFDVIKSMLTKPCSALTQEDKRTADLNYSGCIDTSDAFLMRKTLETRYDEN